MPRIVLSREYCAIDNHDIGGPELSCHVRRQLINAAQRKIHNQINCQKRSPSQDNAANVGHNGTNKTIVV